jgi:N-acetylglutamate synthase
MSDPSVVEPISARGWPAAESADLGGWRLFASSGWTGRINTCWQFGPPDRALADAIEAVEAWYGARGLPPRFKVVEGAASAELVARLTARGYRSYTPTLTMTGALAGEADPQIRVESGIADDFRRVFADPAFGGEGDAGERLEALARIPEPRGFALATADGAPAAVGVCTIEGEWAGVLGMRTLETYRRHGLGRRAFRALGAFALVAGARHGYLQVDADNVPAIALYESEGYRARYLYRYWRPA